MNTEKKAKVLYLCDPTKNELCKKTSCAYNKDSKYQSCTATTDYECAQLDDKGNPIIVATGMRVKPMREDKKAFVAQLGVLLSRHDIQGVKALRYRTTENAEVVDVLFNKGKLTVNVTGDSCLAMLYDIYRALN